MRQRRGQSAALVMPILGLISGATGGGTPSSADVRPGAVHRHVDARGTWHSFAGPLVEPRIHTVDRSQRGADRLTVVLRAGDDVDAVVHAVDEVDVQVAGGPNITSLRFVRPRNVWLAGSSAAVRLDLDDATGDIADDEAAC